MPPDTPRLRFSTWAAEDWPEFHSISTDPEVVRYIDKGLTYSEDRSREFAARQARQFATFGFCNWKLLHKGDGVFAGFCGLQPIKIDGGDDIEIGWWLARRYWGQGLATEAARVVLEEGMSTFGMKRVIAIANPANRASIHIMEKLGMRYERLATYREMPVVLWAIEA
jgi:RimJ/RimL family protein N-acetyltransferase